MSDLLLPQALALSAGAIGIFSLSSWRSKMFSSTSRLDKRKLSPLTENAKGWIDQSSYEVLAAVCDAFMPKFDSADITKAQLEAAMDTVHPSLKSDHSTIFADQAYLYSPEVMKYLCRGAVEAGIPLVAAEAVGKLITPTEQRTLFALLKLLSVSIGCVLVTAKPVAFQDLPLRDRAQVLCAMRDSPLTPLRAFYQTMKRVTDNLFFSYIKHGEVNPAWAVLGYNPAATTSQPGAAQPQRVQGARGEAPEVDRLLREQATLECVCRSLLGADAETHLASKAPLELEVDVVVVGSGAGGGVMAAQLAIAGLRVLVLEKGGYYRAAEFAEWREGQAMEHCFEKGGLCSSVEGQVLVLAGACVGGGTTINWSASFDLPEQVRSDWECNHGLSAFREDGAFEASLQAVKRMMGVNTDNSFRSEAEEKQQQQENQLEQKQGRETGKQSCQPFAVNENNRLLWKGAERMGYVPERIPRNVKGCVDCGHCCHGCPYGSKQSTATALLEPILLSMANRANAGTGVDAVGAVGKEKEAAPASAPFDLHLIPHCYVSKVITEQNRERGSSKAGSPSLRAVGVEAEVQLFSRPAAQLTVQERIEQRSIGSRRLLIRAKAVVSSAGALHTPALLQRSGLRGHPDCPVGAHLALHPVLGTAGLLSKDVNTGLASGVSMGVVIRSPPITATHSAGPASRKAGGESGESDPEECNYWVAPETPPVHPGLMGLMLPWTAGVTPGGSGVDLLPGLATKLGMLGWRNIATFIGISRDRSQRSNRISIDADGHPVVNYCVTKHDEAVLLAGLEAEMRMLRAAGARYMFVAHENFPWHRCATDGNDQSQGEGKAAVAVAEYEGFERYVQAVRREGVRPVSTNVFSAHQLSSCRMGSSPERGPVSPSGELFECQSLFVADGSVLPTALGINPMITIEAVAHMLSGSVLQLLQERHADCKQKIAHFAKHGPASQQQW